MLVIHGGWADGKYLASRPGRDTVAISVPSGSDQSLGTLTVWEAATRLDETQLPMDLMHFASEPIIDDAAAWNRYWHFFGIEGCRALLREAVEGVLDVGDDRERFIAGCARVDELWHELTSIRTRLTCALVGLDVDQDDAAVDERPVALARQGA